MSKTVTNMERIIAKIDNDFNPDNSDWIPRVVAWTIDAMSILKVMQEVTNTKKYDVKERIAYDKCGFGDNIEHVYDENGCEVFEYGTECSSCSGGPFTGKGVGSDTNRTANTDRDIEISKTMAFEPFSKNIDKNIFIETTRGSEPMRHTFINIAYGGGTNQRNYVKVGSDKLELNFDTSFITVESKGIKTECSNTFGCDVPVIPNNGLLIECITAYCIYKMLCRGYKHPVFTLSNTINSGINPYVFWTQNKDKAKDSVTADAQGDLDTKLWRSAFYVDTFDPRR